MVHKFFVAFIPIFVAIDPIGLVAMFMGLAGNTPREQRQKEGFIAIFTALCVSVGFIFLGKIIFTALGITVADFQVAGGLILLGLAGRELLNGAAGSGRYSRPGVYPCGTSGQSRAGCGRLLECRLSRALDGQTRITRGVENSSAPLGCHRS
jgi:hypothetical protein